MSTLTGLMPVPGVLARLCSVRQPIGCRNQNLTGRGPREGLVLVFVRRKRKTTCS
jgi:hypothetical protein